MRYSTVIAILTGILFTGCAINDTAELTKKYNELSYEPVSLNEKIRGLPENILLHIEDQYPGKTITGINASDSEYDINISNHTVLEFNLNGDFIIADSSYEDNNAKEISVEELPVYMLEYIGDYYPGNSIISIENDQEDIKVELSQEVRIHFPK
jgi:hypothetical protein